MKSLLLILSLSISFIKVFGQSRSIPVSKIYQQRVKQYRCLDTNDVVSQFCPLELNNIEVVFYRAYLDASTKQLRLIGRVCLSDTSKCAGIPGIGIFKAVKDNNKLLNPLIVGESSESDGVYDNNGFFDVKFRLGRNESLFFHNTAFKLEEFTVSNLLKRESNKATRPGSSPNPGANMQSCFVRMGTCALL